MEVLHVKLEPMVDLAAVAAVYLLQLNVQDQEILPQQVLHREMMVVMEKELNQDL